MGKGDVHDGAAALSPFVVVGQDAADAVLVAGLPFLKGHFVLSDGKGAGNGHFVRRQLIAVFSAGPRVVRSHDVAAGRDDDHDRALRTVAEKLACLWGGRGTAGLGLGRARQGQEEGQKKNNRYVAHF